MEKERHVARSTSSTLLLAVQKNSVDYIADGVHCRTTTRLKLVL